jgi:zinc/manganese transport system substrate-binding protein
MGEIDSAHHDLFKSNAEAFQKKLDARVKDWQARINKAGIKEVITYHKTLSYFLDRFGIKSVWQLEPKPGIPPTASHLIAVINEMRSHNIKLVLIENFYDESPAEKIRQEIPTAKVVRVPVSVGGESGLTTTEAVIEKLVKVIESNNKP